MSACLKSLCLITLTVMTLTACQLPVGQQVVSGTLHGRHEWSGDVVVAGDVVLAEGAELQLSPGTVVRFLPAGQTAGTLQDHPYFPGSELIVKGRIRAIGTADRPIIFEAHNPDAVAGAWGSINMEGCPEAIFEYCIFRQSDSAVHSRDSFVYIEQSLFENNLVGVRFHSSQIHVENNLFQGNQTAVRFHFGSPVICNNTFIENRVNLFITSYPRDYHIEYNRFDLAGDYQVVLGEEVPDDVLLPHNYWSGMTAVEVAEHFYDGRRSPYLGRVLVEPVLTSPPEHNGFSWNP